MVYAKFVTRKERTQTGDELFILSCLVDYLLLGRDDEDKGDMI
jgi:hypothetical protein